MTEVYFNTQKSKIKDSSLLASCLGLTNESQTIIEAELDQGTLKIKKHKSAKQSMQHEKDQKGHEQKKTRNYFISEFTHYDASNLKKMMETHHERQMSLEAKVKEMQKLLQEESKEEEKIHYEKKREFFQNKKLLSARGLQQINKRNTARRASSHQQNKKLLEIKSRKNLFEKMEEIWRKKQKQENLHKSQEYRKMLDQKKVDFDDIRKHEEEHDQRIEKLRESRLENSKVMTLSTSRFYKSTFLSRVREDDSRVKQQIFQKDIRAKQFAQKRAQYAEIVRQNYQPQHFKKFHPQHPETIPLRSSSQKELYSQGTNYMREVNQKLPKSRATKSQFFQQDKEQNKYRNYLSEMKTKRENTIQRNLTIQPIPEEARSKTQKQVQKILRKKSLSSHQKFKQAKLIVNKYQSLNFKKNPFQLINSINAKIQILKRLQQQQ